MFCKLAETRKYCCFNLKDLPSKWLSEGYKTLVINSASLFSLKHCSPMKKVPNEFNLGMDNRHAIYIPFAQAVPKVATIDPNACNMLKNGKCGVCAKVCAAGAIDYTQKDEIIEEKYGR